MFVSLKNLLDDTLVTLTSTPDVSDFELLDSGIKIAFFDVIFTVGTSILTAVGIDMDELEDLKKLGNRS